MSVSENKTGTLRAEEHGHQPVICIQENAIDRADTAGCNGKGWTEDKSFTLNTIDRPAVFDSQVYHGCKEFADGISQTVNAQYGTGGNNQPLVVCGTYQNTGQGWWNESEIGATVRTPCGGDSNKANLVVQKTSVSIGNGQTNNISMSDKANAPDTMHDQQAVLSFEAVGKNVVRRLTSLECERLQGLPDNWTNIPGASDSQRYRAIGNGIALPFGSTSLTALLRWAR